MVSGPIPRRLLVLSFWVCSEQVPCFRRRCVERVPLAYAISGSSTLTAGVYLLLRVVWICEAACVSFVVRDLVQQQHVAIAALLVSCGALETAHAAAIHTDRLFILRRSVSGGTADPTRAERLLKPLRNGWVHELWCGNLMLVGMMFIAHPQLEPVNSQAICHLLLLLGFIHSDIGLEFQKNARLHVLIGASLILGAHLITADKIKGRPNHRTVLAGMCFGGCAIALRAFNEATAHAIQQLLVI